MKNCYSGNSSVDYSGATTTTCASSDTTGDTGLQNIAHDTATFANVTPATADYRLVADSPLIGVGTNTTGEASPLNFHTDFEGGRR